MAILGRSRRAHATVDPARELKLHWAWRAALGIAGTALVVIGMLWWSSPPQHDVFAPQATDKSAVAKVDAPSEVLSGALVGLGVVLLVVAANGRRLTSIKIGDNEFAFAAAAADAAEAKAKQKAKSRNLDAQKVAQAGAVARVEAFAAARKQPHTLDLDQIAESAIEVAKLG
jgi:hypothetical protein